EALEDVRRKYIGMIKISSVELSRKTEILANAISENKHLFVKPKTFTFHGIKVGLNKSKESFEIEDEERTIKLIEKFFDEEKNFYIDLKKSVKKSALKDLSESELAKIKVVKNEGEDQVLIKSVDDIINKMVNSIIKSIGSDDIKVDIKAA
ncbi:MAG TPA: hypothetical protein DEP28_00130, partial [Bacteroidetes bacterium]|nr:hypothetical protein [Bacteroidota bacterium]